MTDSSDPIALRSPSRDLYTEPACDPATLAQLGPLRRMAGVWEGTRGLDVKPKADGPRKQVFTEHMELQPIDPQTNGPQLLFGLRYHVFITKPNQVKTYHDQVGYWLWEPATSTVMHTLTIPRGQVVMACGTVDPDADTFELRARLGDPVWGICSNPFLDSAFRTLEFKVRVTFNPDGTWGYDEDTLMQIAGQDELFHHTDRNLLHKVGEPGLNPLVDPAATAAAGPTAPRS